LAVDFLLDNSSELAELDIGGIHGAAVAVLLKKPCRSAAAARQRAGASRHLKGLDNETMVEVLT
jgi:hypothetical protein